MKIKKYFSILFLVSMVSIQNSFAQDARSWTASIGAGLAIKKNLRVGNTYKHLGKKRIIRPIPYITGSVGRFSIGAQGLSYMAYGSMLSNVSVNIQRGGERYYGEGMTPRKETFFAGASAKFFNYGFSISHDINGRSKGTMAHFDYGHMFSLSPSFLLRGGARLEWYDDKYAEYYYGVRKFEATATRGEYHLNNFIQPGVNLLPIWKLNEVMSIVAPFGVKFVPKKVRNSPTMNGDRLEFGGLVAFNYKL